MIMFQEMKKNLNWVDRSWILPTLQLCMIVTTVFAITPKPTKKPESSRGVKTLMTNKHVAPNGGNGERAFQEVLLLKCPRVKVRVFNRDQVCLLVMAGAVPSQVLVTVQPQRVVFGWVRRRLADGIFTDKQHGIKRRNFQGR